jgi:hypothetical protein
MTSSRGILKMKDDEILLHLIHRAFVEIRLASRTGDTRPGDQLSDLLHNVPIAMTRLDASSVLKGLRDRAGVLGMSTWITAAMADLTKIESSQSSAGDDASLT